MARYQYQHLQDGRSFRLLSLLPGNDPADPIRCQLQVHYLTEGGQIPQYTALSYVWGDQNLDVHVECEDGILPVNRGCFQALRSLRYLMRNPSRGLAFTPYFWVDAICINQSDEREKSSQVRLMGDIYRSAETVLCFIGDSFAQEDLYVSNHWGPKSGARRRFFRRDSRASEGWKADRDIIGVNNIRESAVRKLFESQYWTRLWTFQEALLSHRKIVLSGTDMIEWESIGTMLQQAAVVKREGINHSLPKAIHFHSLTTTSPMLRLLLDRDGADITKRFNKTYTQSLSLEISRILSFSEELETSEPRDKIYALTGVMAALEVDLVIDYCRPMALIYKDSIRTFSTKTWSFDEFAIKSKDFSFTLLDLGFSNTFHRPRSLPIRTKESSPVSRLVKTTPIQTTQLLCYGEGIAEALMNKSLTRAVRGRTPHFIKEEVNSSENDDESDSSISSSTNKSVELSFPLLAHSLARSFSIRKRDWLISRVSSQLGPILNQCVRNEESGRHHQVTTRPGEHISSQEIPPTDRRHKNQRRRRGQDEHSDDEDDQEHPRKKNKGNEVDEIKKLLACPFHQRNPHRPSVNRSCGGPGWDRISRLKEHLYRVHFVHRCRRCMSRFETASELDSHYEDVTSCTVSSVPVDPMEGFNEKQRENLKCRRVQEWKEIYQILFPDDDEMSIPSQHYASVITIADILDQFDRAYQEEVERQLPGRVRSVLEALPSRPSSSIQDEILLMVNDINSTVINSFRRRMAGAMLDNSDPAPREESEVTTSRVEPNLDNPASFFLEYFNNLGHGSSMSQHLGNGSGFDYNNIQHPTANVYASEPDFDVNLSQLGNFHGAYDERLNALPVVQDGNITMSGVPHTLNQIDNHDGHSTDEWTVVETPPEDSS
ncbi:heterokaryon incompatibility protein-domain-containing protein [Daldinia caldariorum]|uniref:heterokaryon incompatibility protein-domain-containing protein n=1 Tax=Daldinia caldariorum TaxID=326644 RepID=UPI0020079993|nr:heterokaryon incompatibility protein-domain-containing protein [Daldinia caldariorum]KAI1464077.1 heterokaryon incompatibility protein-domain-containing protein [Daldinia caldariorum]